MQSIAQPAQVATAMLAWALSLSLVNTRLVPGLRQEGFNVLPIGRVSGELPAGITEVENIFVFDLLLSLDQGQQEAERLTHITLADYLSPKGGYRRAHNPEPVGDNDYDEPACVLIID